MSEPLCADCPLRYNHPGIDFPRINPDIPSDVEAVNNQKQGSALLAAIAMERPERCQSLRKVLPPETSGVNRQPLAVCPEIGLFKLLYRDYQASDNL